MTEALFSRARAWAQADTDADARAELLGLLETAESEQRGGAPGRAVAELEERFAAPLEFGTAGLRGVIGAGQNRMNRFVVQRTTLGLARTLLAEGLTRGVVIGYDGRNGSRQFAEDTAEVLAAAGVRSFLFEQMVPTPLVAFAVTHFGASAGVMVTASHNPPEYNGYKVYWSDGAQIVTPIDERIAHAIDAIALEEAPPRLALAEARARGLLASATPSIDAYFEALRNRGLNDARQRDLAIAYTPMHGVGDPFTRRALAEAGFSNVVSVPEQRRPDGAFPTVRFPNPEEKGAMDLVLQVAARMNADIALANDPDADRLAAAVSDGNGGYRMLTGNDLGVLLGHHLLLRAKGKGRPSVVSSVVSSPLLGIIAAELGAVHDVTLTGFKWIARRGMELEAAGHPFVFGYEEALGYTVGTVVHDKDGVGAAVAFAELAAEAKEAGRTVLDELAAIHRRFGLFVSGQVTVARPGSAGAKELAALMDRLRKAPPAKLGEFTVVAVSDFQAGTRRLVASGETAPLTLPAQNMLLYELEGGSRLVARPSGTEPKVKLYLDVREVVRPDEPIEDAEARAKEKLAHLTGVAVSITAG
jgi:phosphomannomutase